MNEINTYSDLLKEKEKLETALALQKEIIHNDFEALKEEYRPIIDFASRVGKITSADKSNPLIAAGVNLASEFLIGNMLFSRSNKVARVTMPFIAKKAVTYLLSKGLNIFSKFRKNGSSAISTDKSKT
jgi:hypothetical protein